MIISHDYIDGYLSAYAKLCSFYENSAIMNFRFIKLQHHTADDIELSLKKYFIAYRSEFTSKENLPEFEQYILETPLVLHLIEDKELLTSIERRLEQAYATRKGANPFRLQQKLSPSIKEFYDLLLLFLGEEASIWKIGQQNIELMKQVFDYLGNEDFVFSSKGQVYLLHFGMNY